jgi:hypothetical protein
MLCKGSSRLNLLIMRIIIHRDSSFSFLLSNVWWVCVLCCARKISTTLLLLSFLHARSCRRGNGSTRTMSDPVLFSSGFKNAPPTPHQLTCIPHAKQLRFDSDYIVLSSTSLDSISHFLYFGWMIGYTSDCCIFCLMSQFWSLEDINQYTFPSFLSYLLDSPDCCEHTTFAHWKQREGWPILLHIRNAHANPHPCPIFTSHIGYTDRCIDR